MIFTLKEPCLIFFSKVLSLWDDSFVCLSRFAVLFFYNLYKKSGINIFILLKLNKSHIKKLLTITWNPHSMYVYRWNFFPFIDLKINIFKYFGFKEYIKLLFIIIKSIFFKYLFCLYLLFNKLSHRNFQLLLQFVFK